MIIDRKTGHADRHYAILPSPAFFLCEFVVANPLNCFTTGKRLDFISDSQVLHAACLPMGAAHEKTATCPYTSATA
jgi:hypothetical protein